MIRTYTFLLTLFILCAQEVTASPETCSYDNYQWSTREKRAVNRHRVVHPYNALRKDEIDPVTGCTVCREDQVELNLANIAPFLVCRIVASSIESALNDLIERGEPVHKVVGYRVGMTRGDTDENGLRTRFSNHSYGIAIDINPEHNGLYDHCIRFGPECQLIRGGAWEPQKNVASLAPDGPVVWRLKREGFRWGGEIRGRQKDFMHFSPSGY